MKRNHGFSKKHPTSEDRKNIINAYQNGMYATELAKVFTLRKETIYRWFRKEKSGNSLDRKRSPGSRRPPKIDKKASEKLVNIIKTPATKFGFETDLWDTKRIQIVCKKKLGIKISHVSIWKLLKNIDFSCKKVQKTYLNYFFVKDYNYSL